MHLAFRCYRHYLRAWRRLLLFGGGLEQIATVCVGTSSVAQII